MPLYAEINMFRRAKQSRELKETTEDTMYARHADDVGHGSWSYHTRAACGLTRNALAVRVRVALAFTGVAVS